MKHKSVILFFSLLIFSNNITAQKILLCFDTGYGTYQMTSIKNIIEKSMEMNEIQPHRVSNFPGYLFFRPYLALEYQHANIGVAYTLMSTGSRYSLHDYSGEYKFDTQIIGNTAGIFAEIPLFSSDDFKLLVAAEIGIVFNEMKLSENLQLTNISPQQYDYNLMSINNFVKPYLKATYKIRQNISANVLFGYHVDIIANKMHLEGNNVSITDFYADWDGIRTSIGISYRLK